MCPSRSVFGMLWFQFADGAPERLLWFRFPAANCFLGKHKNAPAIQKTKDNNNGYSYDLDDCRAHVCLFMCSAFSSRPLETLRAGCLLLAGAAGPAVPVPAILAICRL